MAHSTGPTFDRLGLLFIQRYWWRAETAEALARLFGHFLTPDAGQGWFRRGQGPWTKVDEDSWPEVLSALAELHGLWADAQTEDQATYEGLKREGQCTLFVDAQRFRTCVQDTDGLPAPFFLSLEADWSFNAEAGGIVLTPHLRVTNLWPASERWAPPQSSWARPFLSASLAAEVLEKGLWLRVETELSRAASGVGLHPAVLDLGEGPQQPPVFYFVSPTDRPLEAEDYLQGDRLEALSLLGRQLLGTPDLRSKEITGGVLEGCLAVFEHSPKVQHEYCLMLPLDGVDEQTIEAKLQFITYLWHDIDFDASWEVYDITTDLQAEQQFFSLWAGSLDMSMSLQEELSSLLPKPAIQERMFALTHLLGGFLAKLQARAYAGAKQRREYQRAMEWSIRASRRYAQRMLTVRETAGVQLLQNVSDGYTRAYRAYESTVGRAADSAHRLSEQLDAVSKSLAYSASLEERRQERDKRMMLEREERAAKRLNLVLALVAVLAAVPLILGQFDTEALSSAIGWFPFQIGVHFSFWIALVAFAATLLAMAMTLGRGSRNRRRPRRGLLARVEDRSGELYDCYRSFGHAEVQEAILTCRQLRGEDSPEARLARERVDRLDRRLARAAARAMDQAASWGGPQPLPTSDIAWACQAEQRVCRFVLLSDVYDLRPQSLALPLSLCLYRLHYRAGGLRGSPVSDWEWQRVMEAYDYTEAEREALESWAEEEAVRALTAVQFVDAARERGVGVR